MSERGNHFGFRQELIGQDDSQERRIGPGVRKLLLPLLAIMSVLALLAWAMLLGPLSVLFRPRMIIVRGNQIATSAQVLGLAGLPGDGTNSIGAVGSREFSQQDSRWVKSARSRVIAGRRLLVSVEERVPVLPLEVSGIRYWICHDGEIVEMIAEEDIGSPFNMLTSLPMVTLSEDGFDSGYDVASMLMLTASCCRDLLAGRIARMHIDNDGELLLYTDRGLEVRLGRPEDEETIRYRMTVLQKAIRYSDKHADATGIDLRNDEVAYLKRANAE